MKIIKKKLTDLVEDPGNPRTHDSRNIDAIRASLAQFGQAEPLVIQRGTSKIIGGHGRRTAMIASGWTDAACVEVDLDDTNAAALSIALNRTAELAEWDDDALAKLIQGIGGDDPMAQVAAGFSDDELTKLLARATPECQIDPDDVPEPPDDAITRPGDLWIMGDHRLLCGDSAKPEDVDRLLAGAPIHLVNTDPPYNVKVEPRSNNAIAAGLSSFGSDDAVAASDARGMHHQRFDLARGKSKAKRTHRNLRPKDRPLKNDFVSDEEFDRLLDAWFGNIARVLLPGRGFYIWGGYANCGNYPPFLKKHGLYFAQAIIWNKLHPVLTRKDFMGAHEWSFYGWREGAAHHFFGPNNATDLWEVKKINPQSMEHLTAKPAELAVRALQYSSRKGENVLDLFGGSGSTLIGAEQTERKAFLMEIDPLYCDVIADRFQRFTGTPAVLERTGESPLPMKPRDEDMR